MMKLSACCFFIGCIAVAMGNSGFELDDYELAMNKDFPIHKREFEEAENEENFRVEKRNSVTTLENFDANALASHNAARQRHGVPALTYNQNLKSHAITYARKLAATNTFKHDSAELRLYGEGENLYKGYSNEPIDICEAVFLWYNEIKDFNWSLLSSQYNFFPIPTNLGHFTQMVWHDTSQVGCAGAYTLSSNPSLGLYVTYIVCRYKKPGNHRLQFSANVRPLVSQAPPYFRKYSEVCPSCSDKKPDCPSRAAECKKTFFVGEAAREDCPKTCELC